MQIKGLVGQGSVRAGFSGGHSDSIRIVVTDYQTRFESLSLFICSFLWRINFNMENVSVVIELRVPGPCLSVHILKIKTGCVFLHVFMLMSLCLCHQGSVSTFFYILFYFFKLDCCPGLLWTLCTFLVTHLLIKIGAKSCLGHMWKLNSIYATKSVVCDSTGGLWKSLNGLVTFTIKRSKQCRVLFLVH